MSRTYQATGINLKGMPLGEADRLLTILSPEYGFIQAVAPGARKYKSKLRGRSELFVVNKLLIVKGRSLDKIIQAEIIQTYSGLSRDLGKLVASQYLAELVLFFQIGDRQSTELYELFKEHISRIERVPSTSTSPISTSIIAHLTQGIFHLLALAGIAPSTHLCCQTQKILNVDLNDAQFNVGFSFQAGGAIALNAIDNSQATVKIDRRLSGLELALLQKLGERYLPQSESMSDRASLRIAWFKLEKLLRDYAQYYFDRKIKSASSIDLGDLKL
ncbi:MAG: DNA repair protein RecO [Prochloraceae cyanobacterium]|nr:DNA repair protein RecO [Prochloraceae cyanobacterium]